MVVRRLKAKISGLELKRVNYLDTEHRTIIFDIFSTLKWTDNRSLSNTFQDIIYIFQIRKASSIKLFYKESKKI